VTDASFVIIAFNEAERIERALRSITAQAGLDDYEVIVVDDCSSDATAAIVRLYADRDPAVKLISHPVNRGRGAARATGIGAAAGRYVAMVDADIILSPNWFQSCAAALNGAHAVSGTPIPDGDVQYLYTALRLRPRARPSTTTITGNNALFKREVFDRVGFDPSFRNGEDVALSHALADAGLEARVLHDVTVEHEEDKGLLGSLAWMYESGVGATRQLLVFRRLRGPDAAFAVWLAAGVAGAGWAARRRTLWPAAAPLAVTVAVSTAHVRGKFFLRREPPRRVALAVALNTAMLSAYFGGRLAASMRAGARILGGRDPVQTGTER
jgi:glycosyltransferase involved in cell wall biosynthesis